MARHDRVNTTLLLELRDNLFAMRKLLKIQTNKTAMRTLNRTNFLSKSTIEYLVQNWDASRLYAAFRATFECWHGWLSGPIR